MCAFSHLYPYINNIYTFLYLHGELQLQLYYVVQLIKSHINPRQAHITIQAGYGVRYVDSTGTDVSYFNRNTIGILTTHSVVPSHLL